ncbi:14280_t:CDS:2, partial [Entrophospora sp. SA101]
KKYPETNTEKFYPIRLGLKMIHNLKGLTIQAFINQGENNQPIFHCSNGKFLATEKSMSAAVNTIYQQFLESIQSTSKTRISSPKYFGLVNENHLQRLSKGITFFPFMIKVDKFEMLVVNASYDGIKPANGYHITFVEKIQREYYLFSQYYINKQFHVDSYSLTTGEKKYKFQNSDVNELWESIGMFQNLSGRELFLLDNLELKNIIEESCVKFQTMCSDWNQMVFEKLHLEYMKNINNKDLTLSVLNHLHKRKSTLFEWHGLLYNFKIIEKNNSILDETMIRKTRAWKQLLMASGCKQIKIYRNKEYWSKADDIAADLETLELFPEINSHSNLNSSQELKNNELDSDANTFWKSFENAMNSNKRGPDGQHRILSIIAEEFTYSELKKHLNISNDSINAARKHARFYGEGAPISQEDRVTLTKNKFTSDQLKDLETFLHDKNNVSMSSYKTDPKTGYPILYLKATKKEMWEKYHEEYPNGLKRTSFMCRLDGQFKYQEDLGGLCITCDFYGYQEEIKVLNNGFLEHTSCLNHCLLYAFGECKEEHSNSISTGEDIANSNKDLAGTTFAKLILDRSKKISVGTIPGISNYFTFMWPTDEKEGVIEAYEIPNYGKPTIYSVSDIKKLLKNNDMNKPNSTAIDQTTAQSEWKMNIPSQINLSIQTLTVPEVRSKLKEKDLDFSGNKLVIKQRLNQFNNNDRINNFLLINNNDDINLKNLLNQKLTPGFALRSKQKFGKKGGKRLDLKVIEELKGMFL